MIDLRLGDCLEIMRDMPDASVDAVITDPPYGVNKAEWDGAIPPQEIWKELSRIMRDGAPLVVFGGLKYMPDVISALTKHFSYQWVFAWYKPNAMQFGKTGYSVLDVALWFAKGKSKAKNKMRDVIVHPIIPSENDFGHPTPKPEKVISALVECVTNESETVLDCFMGSGTTGVACARLNRNFIGIEINPQYFEIAQRRIAEAQAQLTLNFAEATA